MQELATFSLETDSTVLLQYKNGRKQRVHMTELAKYALSADIEKIKTAYRLRTSFIDTHMPKARMILLVLIGAGVLGITAVAGQKALAEFTNKPVNIQSQPAGHAEVARSLAEPSSGPVVLRQPAAEKVQKVKTSVIARHVSLSSSAKEHGKSAQAEGSSRKDSKLEPVLASLLTILPSPPTQAFETAVTPAPEAEQLPSSSPEASPAPVPSDQPGSSSAKPKGL